MAIVEFPDFIIKTIKDRQEKEKRSSDHLDFSLALIVAHNLQIKVYPCCFCWSIFDKKEDIIDKDDAGKKMKFAICRYCMESIDLKKSENENIKNSSVG